MRSQNRPPRDRAASHATSAVRRLPRCSGPLGLGAKQKPIGPNVEHSTLKPSQPDHADADAPAVPRRDQSFVEAHESALAASAIGDLTDEFGIPVGTQLRLDVIKKPIPPHGEDPSELSHDPLTNRL